MAKGNKTTINEHRRRKEGLKSGSSNTFAEPKDQQFSKKPKVDRDSAKIRYTKVSGPYNGKPLPNRGTLVTRREYLELEKLYQATRAMQIHRLEDIVFFYKVLTSSARHMPLAKLQTVKNSEGDALVISTNKFLRLYHQRFIVPPKTPMDASTRERYQNSIRDYTIRDGLLIKGRWYDEKRMESKATRGKNGPMTKLVPPGSHVSASTLNGNNGEATNTDDVDNPNTCNHPWCNGIVVKSNFETRYYFPHLDDHRVDWLADGSASLLSYIIVEDLCDEGFDDCYCIECMRQTLHDLHRSPSQLNGINGEATNSDDVERAKYKVCDPRKLCKKTTHGHAKERTGANRRVAEAKAKSDENKPIKEIVLCVDETGVAVLCCACSNPTTRYHSTVFCNPCDIPDPIARSIQDDVEMLQGVQDANDDLARDFEEEIERQELEQAAAKSTNADIMIDLPNVDNGANKPSPGEVPEFENKHRVVISKLVEEVRLDTEHIRAGEIPDNIIDEPDELGVLDTSPIADKVESRAPLMVDNGKAEPTFYQSAQVVVIKDNEDFGAIEDYWSDCPSMQVSDDEESGSSQPPSPREVEPPTTSPPSPPGTELALYLKNRENFDEEVAVIDIMINADLRDVHFDRTWLSCILKIFGEVNYLPKCQVKHATRECVLRTTEHIDLRKSFLRYFMFPHVNNVVKESDAIHDLLEKGFYNASIKREIFVKLYERSLGKNFMTPIGAFEKSKEVYAYFLARVITASEDDLDPFYRRPENIMRCVSTWMAVANALVIYHSNYNKIQPGKLVNLGQK